MRRLLLVAVLLCSGAFVAPAAHAARPDVIHGGCFFDTVADPSTAGGQIGVIGDVSITRTGAIPTVPIGATVSCWIEVDGVEALGTRFSYSGFGVQAGVDRLSYAAADDQIVGGCESVTFADGTTQTYPCPQPLGPFYVPPQPVTELLGEFFDFADPLVCTALSGAAGTYGPVTVRPDGDVYVLDPLSLGLNPLYDCPPYLFTP